MLRWVSNDSWPVPLPIKHETMGRKLVSRYRASPSSPIRRVRTRRTSLEEDASDVSPSAPPGCVGIASRVPPTLHRSSDSPSKSKCTCCVVSCVALAVVIFCTVGVSGMVRGAVDGLDLAQLEASLCRVTRRGYTEDTCKQCIPRVGNANDPKCIGYNDYVCYRGQWTYTYTLPSDGRTCVQVEQQEGKIDDQREADDARRWVQRTHPNGTSVPCWGDCRRVRYTSPESAMQLALALLLLGVCLPACLIAAVAVRCCRPPASVHDVVHHHPPPAYPPFYCPPPSPLRAASSVSDAENHGVPLCFPALDPPASLPTVPSFPPFEPASVPHPPAYPPRRASHSRNGYTAPLERGADDHESSFPATPV